MLLNKYLPRVLFITGFLINGSVSYPRKVFVISLDGFGQEYLSRFKSKNILDLYSSGCHPIFMRNQFPTKTFPNHFTLATGLFTESHGVLDSTVYDPLLKKVLSPSDRELFQQNENIFPIWILNEIHGGRSACFMWPGCGFTYGNVQESVHIPYNKSRSFKDLITAGLNLLRQSGEVDINIHSQNAANNSVNETENFQFVPESLRKDVRFSDTYSNNRAFSLVMLYYPQPDKIGHAYGSNSSELEKIVQNIDADVGYLRGELVQSDIDLIILSDHGMLDVPPEHVIKLKEIVNSTSYFTTGSSPLLSIHPNTSNDYALFNKLKDASSSHHYQLLTREDVSENLHLKHNHRVADILLLANPGYVFDDYSHFFSDRPLEDQLRNVGAHGYNPMEVPSMLPFMFAYGPSFRENCRVPGIGNEDVFPFLCKLLSLPAPPNNGTADSLALMMRQSPIFERLNLILAGLGSFIFAISLLGLALYCRCSSPNNPRSSSNFTNAAQLIRDDENARTYRPIPMHGLSMLRTSAIMVAEDDADEEQKLLSENEVWEV